MSQTLVTPRIEYYPPILEVKPAVTLTIIILIRFDIEKAYTIGIEIAKSNDAIFQGIGPWSLTNPNRDAEYLTFIANVDSINNIIEKIKIDLNLNEENLLYTVTPTTRPKIKPPSSMTA